MSPDGSAPLEWVSSCAVDRIDEDEPKLAKARLRLEGVGGASPDAVDGECGVVLSSRIGVIVSLVVPRDRVDDWEVMSSVGVGVSAGVSVLAF